MDCGRQIYEQMVKENSFLFISDMTTLNFGLSMKYPWNSMKLIFIPPFQKPLFCLFMRTSFQFIAVIQHPIIQPIYLNVVTSEYISRAKLKLAKPILPLIIKPLICIRQCYLGNSFDTNKIDMINEKKYLRSFEW